MTQPPPAAPPAAPPGAPPTYGPSGPRANFGQRLVAFIIDVVIVSVALFVLVGIAFAIDDSLGVIAYILAIIAGAVYFAYFEGSPSGQTVGKKAVSIRVVDFNTGGPLGFGRGLIRWVARIPSQIVCYLGYFWMLWDREKQTWHDKLATTVVVPESAYPVEKWPG
jgi:uncharacterized RDD family membrane protein YckC